MPVGSLRRHRPSQPHPTTNENENNVESDQLSLRNKRNRAASLHDQEELHKRRRLANNAHPQKLRIPLRNRTGLQQQKSDAFPHGAGELPTPATSVGSPTPKAQYDQFRRVEEKARAAITQQKTDEDDRRKLRSEHGGSRSKTELAQYFPNFEDMLSLEPPDPASLTIRTKVILQNDTPNYTPPLPSTNPFGTHKPLHATQVIPLPSLLIPQASRNRTSPADPMSEETYAKTHRKAERHEKQMKNGDRERAQHEKYQLERLLDDLRGPDWLKTLGISGITETERKRYEPKRALFIRETQALINKFKWWKEEEKRRKIEREQQLAEEAAEVEEAELDGDDDADSERSASTHPPNSSELDALASAQLLEEAKSASKRRKTALHDRDPPSSSPMFSPPPPPAHLIKPEPAEPEKPFVSFFAKKHLRDAAVTGRQRGRMSLAFGVMVPEFRHREFGLPRELLTEGAIKASQRSGRRRRRGVDD